MHYYIDGYNILFSLLKSQDNLQVSRNRLIQSLKIKIEKINLPATVVFDSQFQEGESERLFLGQLEVVFTDAGQTADDYILERIKEVARPQDYTVVTSDKKLSWLARRKLAKTESCKEFLSFLEKRYKNSLKDKDSTPLKKKVEVQKKIEKPLNPLIKPSPNGKLITGPKKGASEKELLEYYLDKFDKEIPVCSVKKKPIKKLKKKENLFDESNDGENVPYITDRERWEKIFSSDNNRTSGDEQI